MRKRHDHDAPTDDASSPLASAASPTPAPEAPAEPTADDDAEPSAPADDEDAGDSPADDMKPGAPGEEAPTSTDTPAPADDSAGTPRDEVERLVREAYLRGRNEAIERLMEAPAMLQPLPPEPRRDTAATADSFLARPRRSIWDVADR